MGRVKMNFRVVAHVGICGKIKVMSLFNRPVDDVILILGNKR